MSQSDGSINAVEMMRSIRDRISGQIRGLSLEEEVRWLRAQDLHDPTLQRLRDKAARQQHTADGATLRR